MRGRHSTPYCSSIAMLPTENTTSVRPPVSSSSVAADCATIVGSLRITCVTPGARTMRSVRAAAAPNRAHMSLW